MNSCQLCRFAESNNACQILSSGSSSAFLCSAVKVIGYSKTFSDKECTLSLRPVNLMRRHTHKVNSKFFDINRNIAKSLYSISMENNLMCLCNFSNLLNRLQCPDFIVNHHYTDKYGFISDRVLKLIQIDSAVLVNIQISNIKPLFFKEIAGMEHCMVLYLGCYNVISFFFKLVTYSEDSPVVCFCAAGGKEYLSRLSVYKCSHLFSGMVDCIFGLKAFII